MAEVFWLESILDNPFHIGMRLLLTLSKGLALAAIGLTTVLPTPISARLRSLEHLVVFSDSLSDTGNSALLSGGLYPPPPYSMGRFSNGPVAVEYLWQLFNPGNTNFAPSLAGGTNYSVGGATTGLESFYTVAPSSTIPDLLKPFYFQKANSWALGEFLANTPGFNRETTLFVVWLFPNDVLYWDRTGGGQTGEGLKPGTFLGGPGRLGNAGDLIVNGIQNIAGTIAQLAAMNARYALVPNMPDLGKTPLFNGTPEGIQLSGFTELFNQNLELALDGLQLALPSMEIIQFQSDNLFASILNDPAAFGFTNVTDACINDLVVTPQCDGNQDSYLFWDNFHPTTAAHQVFGNSFYAAVRIPVPVPGPIPLMGLGVAFGWSRHLRRRLRGESR